MIRYALTCTAHHDFESWFQSSAAYDRLLATGRVTCPICGIADVRKALMAPALRSSGSAPPPASAPPPGHSPPGRPSFAPPLPGIAGPAISGPAPEPRGVDEAIAALRRHIERNSDYVGPNFAAEARRIHAGDAPERSIHGEARPEEARKLIEDGVPVAALPFVPRSKTN